MNLAPDLLRRPTIGIITALPKEYAAVKGILEQPQELPIAGVGVGRRYMVGTIPAPDGRHFVVLALAEMGNNIAAIRATLLLEHFPNVRSILMVGIAGGVPHPHDAAEHVRLGDIVVSDARGVVQYDFVKQEITETRHQHPPRPPSPVLLEAVKLLEVATFEGQCPWVDPIERLRKELKILRPATETDVLFSSDDPPRQIDHPKELVPNQSCKPRVFQGPIASANKLLRNPRVRDALRDKFGVKAVEMEGSGVADATWNHEVGYLVVRGICDYCDSNKNNTWQAYAAIAAAGYTRALIESMPVQPPPNPKRALRAKPGMRAALVGMIGMVLMIISLTDIQGRFVEPAAPIGDQEIIVPVAGQEPLRQNVRIEAGTMKVVIFYDSAGGRLGLFSIATPADGGTLEVRQGQAHRATIEGRCDGLGRIFGTIEIWVLIKSYKDPRYWVQHPQALIEPNECTWRANAQLGDTQYPPEDGEDWDIVAIIANQDAKIGGIESEAQISIGFEQPKVILISGGSIEVPNTNLRSGGEDKSGRKQDRGGRPLHTSPQQHATRERDLVLWPKKPLRATSATISCIRLSAHTQKKS